MEIKTKYSVGDTVFYFSYSTVNKATIHSVFFCTDGKKVETRYSLNVDFHNDTSGSLWNRGQKAESDLYSSADEIIEKIRQL